MTQKLAEGAWARKENFYNVDLELDLAAFSVPVIELSVRMSSIRIIMAVRDLVRLCAARACSWAMVVCTRKNLNSNAVSLL